ncbi:hypothetical protein ACVWXN_003336 [Bradyrhizobium sp. i1.4.4]
MTGEKTSKRVFRIGFQTSIITVFVGVVLLVGLTLVYLSFERVTAITRTAASGFIEKVAQLGADHIDEQFKNVRDNLDILSGLPPIQEADIADNTRLYSLMAAMLRNNPQLFNLYVGYEDGSFIEMDVIDRAQPSFRKGLNVDEDAAFRLVVISRTTGGRACHAVSLRKPHSGCRGRRTRELRPAAAALVCRGVQERQDAVDRSLRLLRHGRAGLHAADAVEGRAPRRHCG